MWARTRRIRLPDGFYSKPIWQRALVIAAGPFMSFVFGYVVFCLMGCTTGIPSGKVLTRISLVEPGGEGHRIGLRAGDVITQINGQPVADGNQMVAKINGSLGKPLLLTVQRDGQTLTKTATPRPAMKDDKPVLYTDVVRPGAFGTQIGLLPGDTVRGIGTVKIENTDQALHLLQSHAGQPVDIVVTRPASDDAVNLHGVVPAAPTPDTLPTFSTHPIGALKIDPSAEIKHLGFVASIKEGNLVNAGVFRAIGRDGSASQAAQGQHRRDHLHVYGDRRGRQKTAR